MKLIVKKLRFLTGRPVCMIHEETAKKMSLHVGNRVIITNKDHKKIISVVDTVTEIINTNEIAVSEEILDILNLKDKEIVNVEITEHPRSISFIKKKLKGQKLTKEEIVEIIKDIASNALTEVEVAFFISAVYIKDMSLEETKNLIKAMVESGNRLELKGTVADKHCLPFDTPLLVKNKGKIEFTKIGDIIEKFAEDPNKEFSNKINEDLKVLSWDDNYKVKFTSINTLHKIKSPDKLVKVILRGNREISLTKDHSIFILKNGKVMNIPSKEIKKGDYVLVPRNFDYKDIIEDINLKFDNIIKKNGIIKQELKITPEFLRFIGYYLSEGFSNYQGVFLNFGSHEKDLINDSIQCIKKVFGIEPTINYPHKTAVRVCVYSRELSKSLEKNLEWGDCATNKSIPSFIFGLNTNSKLEFIKALFEGGGYVRRGYEAIYVTVSENLTNQLSYLLSLMGMSVSISTKEEHVTKFPKGDYNVSKSYYLYTQAREILGNRKKDNVSFINLFPIKEAGDIEKKDLGWVFRRALKNQKYVTREKFQGIKKYLNGDFRSLIDSDISVLEVKDVKEIKSESKFVYDLTTNEGRFIAGFVPICIHNCIGGIAGNRTTPIVVSIGAAAGLIMPKTSSRAITSAAGTADSIETIARVDFSINEIKKIIKKTNACLVWGGTLGLAPVDDKIIKIERIVNIDSTAQLLASILSKKISVGSKYILIDIPNGRSSKVTKKQALKLKEKFIKLGKIFGLKIEVILTEGSEPIGKGIGPALEIKDVIKVLNKDINAPKDLEEKSLVLAGKLLELSGKAKKTKGFEMAKEILNSGKAFKKFKQIIEAQEGNLEVFQKPKFSYDIKAKERIRINHLDNKMINKIARFAGCPEDQAAGIYLHKKKGEIVEKNHPIFTIYAVSEEKLKQAKILYEKNKKKVFEYKRI